MTLSGKMNLNIDVLILVHYNRKVPAVLVFYTSLICLSLLAIPLSLLLKNFLSQILAWLCLEGSHIIV